MVSVTVDNIKVNISSESTVLEACNFAGIIVPRFCFHKKLSIAGNCRMCIVEIEKFPKPVSSCTLKVSNGMRIFTKTPLVRKAQETVLEFLLIKLTVIKMVLVIIEMFFQMIGIYKHIQKNHYFQLRHLIIAN